MILWNILSIMSICLFSGVFVFGDAVCHLSYRKWGDISHTGVFLHYFCSSMGFLLLGSGCVWFLCLSTSPRCAYETSQPSSHKVRHSSSWFRWRESMRWWYTMVIAIGTSCFNHHQHHCSHEKWNFASSCSCCRSNVPAVPTVSCSLTYRTSYLGCFSDFNSGYYRYHYYRCCLGYCLWSSSGRLCEGITQTAGYVRVIIFVIIRIHLVKIIVLS